MTTGYAAAVRVNHQRPHHHLCDNHGTWWCHLTFHLPDFTKNRLRISLDTKDLKEAKVLRDSLLRLFGCGLS